MDSMLLDYTPSMAAPGAKKKRTPRAIFCYLEKRLAKLRKIYEDDDWKSHHMELSDFLLPRRGKFLSKKKRKGSKINRNVLTPTPFRAAETCANGLYTGLTSKARLWFNVSLEDATLLDMPGVRRYLSRCEQLMSRWLDSSNFYSVLPELYLDLVVFGTAPSLIVEDYETMFRVETFEPGEYYIARNRRGVIDALFREYEDTVENVVAEFGIDNVSTKVKEAYEKEQFEDMVKLAHAIEPNRDQMPGAAGADGMAYRSVYWERDLPEKNKFLRYKGYEECPLAVPRWSVSGTDAYGRSLGMDALPEVKQLKQAITRKEQGKERLTIPPLVAPASLKTSGANLLPGAVNYLESTDGQVFRSVYEKYDPQLQVQMLDIEALKKAIKEIFYNDVLFAISNMEGVQPRNVLEIMERKDEKLQQLGGGVERFETDFLETFLDRLWAMAARKGMLPPPPRVLEEKKIKFLFVGPLALAQKSQSIMAMERTTAYIGSLAKSFPEAADMLDPDAAINEYVDLTNTPTSIIRPFEQVQQRRQMRARQLKQQEAAQAAGTMQQVAAGAELLSRTRAASGRSALAEVETAAAAA